MLPTRVDRSKELTPNSQKPAIQMVLQPFAGDCRVLPDAGTKELAFGYCAFPTQIPSAVSKRSRCSDGVFAHTIRIPDLKLVSVPCAKMEARDGNCNVRSYRDEQRDTGDDTPPATQVVGSVAVGRCQIE